MSPKNLLRLAGLSIFVAGMTASSVLLFFGGTSVDSEFNTDSDISESPQDFKSGRRQMEMIGGKANLLGADLSRWFAELWHGRNLPITIYMLTAATSGCLLWISDRTE